MMNKNIKAVIFGFDGVVFHTDIYHFLSWKKSLQTIGINIDPAFQYKLNGINRQESLEEILQSFGLKITKEEKENILKIKNEVFYNLAKELCEFDVAPGIIDLLIYLKDMGVKTALSTTSVNSYDIMKRTGMDQYFDFIPKPEEILSFKELNIDSYNNIVKNLKISQLDILCIEGSQIGIDTANEMFIKTVGIDYYGSLKNSLYYFKTTSELTTEAYDKIISELNEFN